MTEPVPTQEPETTPEETRVEEAAVSDEIAAVAAERDQLLDDLQRVAADFDNFRKRAARDQASTVERANERLVQELLPILDDLGRALEAAPSHEEAAVKPPVRGSGPVEGARGNREVPPATSAAEFRLKTVLGGVELVERSLASLLEREGLAEIETDGKFDPHVHEALLSQPSDAEEGSILDVVQKGYRLGDKVIRPARVVVARALAEE
jgi:molecular chaperone GrpE